MEDYDILTKYSWNRTNISYGFKANVPLGTRNLFQAATHEINQISKLSLTELPEYSNPDILIGFADTQGYVALAYFPGEHEISGDILLSQEFLTQQPGYQNFIVRHELGHAVGLGHVHDRTDSVMSYNLEGGIESLAQGFTPYDFWAINATYHNVGFG